MAASASVVLLSVVLSTGLFTFSRSSVPEAAERTLYYVEEIWRLMVTEDPEVVLARQNPLVAIGTEPEDVVWENVGKVVARALLAWRCPDLVQKAAALLVGDLQEAGLKGAFRIAPHFGVFLVAVAGLADHMLEWRGAAAEVRQPLQRMARLLVHVVVLVNGGLRAASLLYVAKAAAEARFLAAAMALVSWLAT